jgi:hypothetical protein
VHILVEGFCLGVWITICAQLFTYRSVFLAGEKCRRMRNMLFAHTTKTHAVSCSEPPTGPVYCCGVARILKLKLDAQGALKKREGSSLDYYNCGILSILKSSLSNINVRWTDGPRDLHEAWGRTAAAAAPKRALIH